MDLKKSLGDKQAEQDQLLKGIGEVLDVVGMRPHGCTPRKQMDKQDAAANAKAVYQQNLAVLEKAAIQGRIRPEVLVQYQISGQVDDRLLKALKA